MKDFIEIFKDKNILSIEDFFDTFKKSQMKSFPSKDYRKELLFQLRAEYIISGTKEKQKNISFYQVIGLCFSCVFIFTSLFVYLYVNQESIVYEPKLYESEDIRERDEVYHSEENEVIPSPEDIGEKHIKNNSSDFKVKTESFPDSQNINELRSIPQNIQINTDTVIPESTDITEENLLDMGLFEIENIGESVDMSIDFELLCYENNGKITRDEFYCDFGSGRLCTSEQIMGKSCQYLHLDK